ncbi:MAG: polyprenol monophosphomannose synthase [Candidatus Omnitrophica bacterium]|nr:polyprenol monophosphomannose synthase [Candidatus Omnitrophota bacterium]
MPSIAVIPTYNEKQNIEELISQILETDPNIHILIVDDKSPDGTDQLVREAAKRSARVHLLSREGKRGRGLAGITGFQYAVREGFDPILEMDADFSHDPKEIPHFLEAIRSSDVVIGSRFVAGGGESGRGMHRRLLSRAANKFTRTVLGLAIKDCTSGFRCFRRRVLESLPLQDMFSEGPSIIAEVLCACKARGYSIREIPIWFKNRGRGKSKLNAWKVLIVLWNVVRVSLHPQPTVHARASGSISK